MKRQHLLPGAREYCYVPMRYDRIFTRALKDQSLRYGKEAYVGRVSLRAWCFGVARGPGAPAPLVRDPPDSLRSAACGPA